MIDTASTPVAFRSLFASFTSNGVMPISGLSPIAADADVAVARRSGTRTSASHVAGASA